MISYSPSAEWPFEVPIQPKEFRNKNGEFKIGFEDMWIMRGERSKINPGHCCYRSPCGKEDLLEVYKEHTGKDMRK